MVTGSSDFGRLRRRYVALRRQGWRPIIVRFILTGSTRR